MNPDYKNLTKIPYFRRMVLQNFPFIEEDFDALTDYGFLCKVVEYLNKVIEQQNLVNDNTDALHQAYIELKNYVENYFTNLDVQEEINNKLDSMAQDGTLQEIIADYLNSKAVFGFDTVESMKNATNLINGSYAKTLGYYTKNDGGSATYKIRTITNEDVVDDMFILSLNDETLIAELIIDYPLAVEKIGAKGDNTQDDTLFIQNALNKTNNIILNKIYKTTDTIDITSNQIIILNGEIHYTGINSALEITGNRNILNLNKIYSDAYGITLNCSSVLEANRINVEYINSTKHCIQLLSTNGGNVYNEIRFTTLISTVGYYCIYLYSGTNAYVGENTFYGGKCQRGTWGVYSDSNHVGGIPTVKLYNICFEGVKNGIYFNNTHASTINYPRYAEMIESETDGILLSLNGDCRDCVFNGNNPVYMSKIVNNLTAPVVTSLPRGIKINAPVFMTGGSSIGNKAIITKDYSSIYPCDIRRVNITSSYANHVFGLNEFQPQWFDVNYSTTIKLSTSYIPDVINELYVNYTGAARLIIKDVDDNTIHDGTNFDTGVYKITVYRSGNNYQYITEKLNIIS